MILMCELNKYTVAMQHTIWIHTNTNTNTNTNTTGIQTHPLDGDPTYNKTASTMGK